MNKNAIIEYIRAEDNTDPSITWRFSVLDQSCLPMVIRGTWIFDVPLDVNVMKSGLKNFLTTIRTFQEGLKIKQVFISPMMKFRSSWQMSLTF